MAEEERGAVVGGGHGLGAVGRCHGFVLVLVLVLVLVFVGKSGDSPLRYLVQNSSAPLDASGQDIVERLRATARRGIRRPAEANGRVQAGASLWLSGPRFVEEGAGWRWASARGRGLSAARPAASGWAPIASAGRARAVEAGAATRRTGERRLTSLRLARRSCPWPLLCAPSTRPATDRVLLHHPHPARPRPPRVHDLRSALPRRVPPARDRAPRHRPVVADLLRTVHTSTLQRYRCKRGQGVLGTPARGARGERSAPCYK